MSPERDDPTDDQELYEDVPPRSIFAATWFRVVLVLIVLGVFGAVAVPYVLDWMNPPPAVALGQRQGDVAGAARRADRAAARLRVSASSSASTSSSADSHRARRRRIPRRCRRRLRRRSRVPSPSPSRSRLRSRRRRRRRNAPWSPTAKSSMAATDSTSEGRREIRSRPPRPTPRRSRGRSRRPSRRRPKAATEDRGRYDGQPATKRRGAKATPPASAARTRSRGPFWVQVGAFKDPDTAKRVADRAPRSELQGGGVRHAGERQGGGCAGGRRAPRRRRPRRRPAISTTCTSRACRRSS